MQDIGASDFATIGDVTSINFRPSPNFKYMKKYLKSKFEEAVCAGGSSKFNSNLDQELSKKEDNTATKKVDNTAKTNVASQPPLPPGSPPPDNPPNFVLKKEVIDDGYENSTQHQNDTGSEYDQSIGTQTVTTDKPNNIMCKDFVRGTCKRIPCYYMHELDLKQLKGVYKFCRDFANGKCRRPVCFFVHASTFEKENFFRTGVLPPHTLSHLKDSAVAQHPMPVSEAPAQQCMPIYPAAGNPANPPQPACNSCVAPVPLAMTVPPAASADPGVYMFPQHHQPTTYNWNAGNVVARETEEEVPKNCINCQLLEISYQQNKTKLEVVEKSTKMLKENILILDQKKAKLMRILAMMLLKNKPNTL